MVSKFNVLFCGERPESMSGNGNMMAAILSQVDSEKYKIACFGAFEPDPAILDIFVAMPFSTIPAKHEGDEWGNVKLLRILQSANIDVLVMVGIDIWRYAEIWNKIDQIRKQKKFKWVTIFPYDLQHIYNDWIDLINMVDYPCVYSEYGFKILQGHISNIQYFRPSLNNAEIFQPYNEAECQEAKRKHFPSVRDNQTVFGFVGANQIRKEPQKLIKAYAEAKKINSNIMLYLHTELDGTYDLIQVARDCGLQSGDVLAKIQGIKYYPMEMVKIYNSFDCLVNCSMQEGLSWTLIEAMLCGVPIIASDTTAQTELVENVGHLIPCDTSSYLPLVTSRGPIPIETQCCCVEDITKAILKIADDVELRKTMKKNGLKKGQEWLDGVSNINSLLGAIGTKTITTRPKIEKILFAQHSSAGDVLMSTQCFKGIKERHPGMKLIYMTQPQYWDVVIGNPYIDGIIKWNRAMQNEYEVVYNPHGEHILPGGFNSLDTKLYEMYPYFCKVEADEMFIEQVRPANRIWEEKDGIQLLKQETIIDLPEKYIVVHTTGGQTEYRSYKHMDMTVKNIGLPVIQIGGRADLVCQVADIDFRGKLDWRETAWIMAHAEAAIVIDSFPAHLAGAVGTPVVVLFGPAPARVTGPKGDPEKIINLEPNKLDACPVLTNCWGHPGKKCKNPCINTINPISVRKALLSLLKQSEKKEG